MAGLSAVVAANRTKSLPRLGAVEQQAVGEYRRALRAKLTAARALAVAKCGRDLDAAYAAMDAADAAIRRGLRTLNEVLTMGDV